MTDPGPGSGTIRDRRRGRTGRILGLTLLLLLVLAVWAGWETARLPDRPLPVSPEQPRLLRLDTSPAGPRRLAQVVLEVPGLGPAGLALSLPEPLPANRLPVLIILGGLASGAETLAHLPEAGANVLAGYDWPMPRPLPRGAALVRALPDLYGRLLAAPGELAAALDWLVGQPWADPARVTLMGFSLGALAVPAVQRLAAARGHRIGWTILAYGGAPIGDLLAAHPKVPANWLRPLLAPAASLLFRPLDPLTHLPHLEGRFLVLGGQADRLIPAAAAEHLAAAVPAPKTVLRFEGDHMGVGPDQQELLRRITDASTAWLVTEGAVNPPPSEAGRR